MKYLVELATTIGSRITYRTILIEVASDNLDDIVAECEAVAARDVSGRTEWRAVQPLGDSNARRENI